MYRNFFSYMRSRTLQNFDEIKKTPPPISMRDGIISNRANASNNIHYNMHNPTSHPPLRTYNDIADTQVGFIPAVNSKTVESLQTLDEYLSDIQNGKYKSAVEHYRTFINDTMPIELKSDAARNYKASVPCCVPHSNCTTAPISNALPQNGLMQVDIDRPSLGNLYVSEAQIKAALDACPYIFAYHKSIGGEGYVGYAHTADAIDKAFWGVAEDLQKRSLYVDLSKGSGTGEKRFMSYDPALVVIVGLQFYHRGGNFAGVDIDYYADYHPETQRLTLHVRQKLHWQQYKRYKFEFELQDDPAPKRIYYGGEGIPSRFVFVGS